MPPEPGLELLGYRLAAEIGRGGMGSVWRATDTTLGRDVAIKLLPDEVAAEPERRARFEREAKLLAAMSHPNIAAVHGLHDADGIRFLAMELIEGETLAARLERSRPPLSETSAIVRQIAMALEAAHDRGVIHRDLKPGNVMVRPDGLVKVLDFGLAREAVAPEVSDGVPDAPTIDALSRPGLIVGTPSYMSPEQARGHAVDKRTDIWSLGCLLFECLTGERPFSGATATDVLAQVVGSEPNFARLPSSTPPHLLRLLSRCLEKDPRRRLRDAGEVRIALEGPGADPGASSPSRPRRRGVGWPSLLAGVAIGGLIGVLVQTGSGRRSFGPGRVSQWAVPLPEGSRVALPSPGGGFNYSRMVAISGDGSRIAFTVQDREDRAQLHLKEEDGRPRPLPGTENGRAPFFSPDARWVGFEADDALHRIAVDGGSPQKICDLGRVVSFDATWSPDGETIVFATDDGLWRVAAAGGEPEQLTTPARERGEVGHHAPRFTDDGEAVLFSLLETPATHVALLTLADRTWSTVIPDASLAIPIGDDRVVFARSGELLVAPYDATAGRLLGSTRSALEGVHATPGLGGFVQTQYDISRAGTLVYVPAGAVAASAELVWVALDGTETSVAEGPGMWVHPRLSPDGSRISLDIHSTDGMRDVYIYELDRARFRQLTRTGQSWESEWHPDGTRLAVMSGAPAGHWSLFEIATDFSGPAKLLHRSSHAVPGSWSPDGAGLLYTEFVLGGIWRLDPPTRAGPTPVLHSDLRERFPRLSPDGRWIAYVADEAGRPNVFVQAYPGLGPRLQISNEEGTEPVWSRDGLLLFYRAGDSVNVVERTSAGAADFGAPRALFASTHYPDRRRGAEPAYDSARVGHQHYDVSLDGRALLMIRNRSAAPARELRVVLNWTGSLGGTPSAR